MINENDENTLPENIENEEETPVNLEESEEAKALEAAEAEAALSNEEELLEEMEATEAEESSEEDAPRRKVEITEDQMNFVMAAMETLLFMNDKPLTLPKMRSLVDPGIPLQKYRECMQKLKEDFSKAHRGVDIVELPLGFQLRTKPQMATILRNLVKTVPLKLTPSMMEVLAMVAYKQPVTKDDIDQIRGVDCSYLLRALMEKRLVRITGRSEHAGRPMIYGTTHEFLELFNLKDTAELPALHEIENMVAASEVGVEDRQKEQLDEFGQMVDESLKTVLFDDTLIDAKLTDIRSTIKSIRTSTSYLDEQKAYEKVAAKLAELRAKGLSDEEIEAMGITVLAPPTIPEPAREAAPSEIVTIMEEPAILEAISPETTPVLEETSAALEASDSEPSTDLEQSITTYHSPSEDLIAAAEKASEERHREIIEATIEETLNLSEPEAEPEIDNQV